MSQRGNWICKAEGYVICKEANYMSLVSQWNYGYLWDGLDHSFQRLHHQVTALVKGDVPDVYP